MKFCIVSEDIEYNVTSNHHQKVLNIIINLRKKYPYTFSGKDFNLHKHINKKKLDTRQRISDVITDYNLPPYHQKPDGRIILYLKYQETCCNIM